MKYDTNNIDEATYLVLQGYHFTVARTGPISALFSFEIDKHFNEVRAKFWKGEASVQLHRWLATRAALKNECAGQALSAKRVPSPSLVPAEREAEVAVVTRPPPTGTMTGLRSRARSMAIDRCTGCGWPPAISTEIPRTHGSSGTPFKLYDLPRHCLTPMASSALDMDGRTGPRASRLGRAPPPGVHGQATLSRSRARPASEISRGEKGPLRGY